MPQDHPLEDVLSKAIDDAEGDAVSLRDTLELFDDRSFGPIFTLLGLIVVVPPVGGIPGLPAAIGLVILLFSIQIVFGRGHVWLPGPIANLSISKQKLEAAQKKSRPVLARVDKLVTKRLEWAASGAARYAGALLVSVLALAMIPLELVPFAVAAPGLAIASIGLALLARDGALMIFSYVISGAALTILLIFSPLSAMLGL